VDLGVDRQHHRRVVGRRIGVGDAAAKRAAIAHLLIADVGGRIGKNRAGFDQQRGRRHVVMDGAGTDLDLPVLLADAGEFRDPRNVNQRLRLAEPELHERHEAVSAGDQFRVPLGRLQLRDGIVERRRTGIFEGCRDHARPP
jgi:hypothetical protein